MRLDRKSRVVGAEAAGLAQLPVTVVMMLLSGRIGALTPKIGPRRLMTAGGLLTAVGTLLLARLGANPNYWVEILPAPDTISGTESGFALRQIEERRAGGSAGRHIQIVEATDEAHGVNIRVRGEDAVSVRVVPRQA